MFINRLVSLHVTILILDTKGKAYYFVFERPRFQIFANLLSLRTSLTALQTVQPLLFRDYLKIAINLIDINIGLRNYNVITRL